MPRTRLLRCARIIQITTAVFLLVSGVASAQDVSEATLKAAFIYNFAKFTDWPTTVLAAAEPLAFCVIGDLAVGAALTQAVKGRLLAGRSMDVSQGVRLGPSLGCHVVYLSGVTAARAAELVAGLRDEPVLTMSDVEGFTERGGIAQCFFEHGQLRFNVRLESMRRARLQISSRLLTLARTR